MNATFSAGKFLGSLTVMGLLAAAPAHATLTVEGVSYDLSESVINSMTHQFQLSITGINAPADTRKGRYGVESFAFNKLANFSSAGAPTGFGYADGGLNASGCNGTGNFFCFSANTDPVAPPMAAGSSLSYLFTITLSAGSFAGYNPDFKINWLGTENNYDNVSLALTPTTTRVPEPGTLGLFAFGLLAFGLTLRTLSRSAVSQPAA